MSLFHLLRVRATGEPGRVLAEGAGASEPERGVVPEGHGLAHTGEGVGADT